MVDERPGAPDRLSTRADTIDLQTSGRAQKAPLTRNNIADGTHAEIGKRYVGAPVPATRARPLKKVVCGRFCKFRKTAVMASW